LADRSIYLINRAVALELSVRHLRYFLLVAELGSFRAAAVRIGRSQPALSLAIGELEQRLGQKLFEPSTRATLTSYGRMCLPLARELVESYERTSDSIGKLARNEAGSLTLASIVSLAMHWLPDVVSRYVSLHPGVRLRLLDDNSPNIERMVLSGEVDLGLCSEVSHDERLAFEPLLRDEFGIVCRTGHPLARCRSLTWRDLRDTPLIDTVTNEVFAGLPEAKPLHYGALFISNTATLLSMLERGLGVSVLPRLALPPASATLRFIPLARPRIERTLGMMTLKNRMPSPPAAAMHDLLKHQVRRRRP
jgi:DNA-binding transcriptional LysR family regulator